MITDGRKGGAPCGPEGRGAPVPEQEPTKIKIRLRLDALLVGEARRLDLDGSRIADEVLTREIEAERHRRQTDRGGDRESSDGAGSSTTET